MRFLLSKSDFNFLKNEMPYAYEMTANITDNGKEVSFDVEEVGDFQTEMTMAVVDDGMDDEDTVNKKGIRMYSIYDILLAQKQEYNKTNQAR